jgi:hypothetical protein
MVAIRKSLEHCRCQSHSIVRKKENVVFKRVIVGLFAISMVAMLWIEASAQNCPFDFAYCFPIGGSEICGCYGEGSLIAAGSITCNDGPECIKSSVKFDVQVFGTVPDPAIPPSGSGPCSGTPFGAPPYNKECAMIGRLDCGNGPTETTLYPFDDPVHTPNVTFPLTGKANLNCTSGSCITTIEIDVGKCDGNAANCCPNCCPRGTSQSQITFTPTSFNVSETYSQNSGAKTGPSQVNVASGDCSLVGGSSSCTFNGCTFTGPCGGYGVCSSTSCGPCDSEKAFCGSGGGYGSVH